MKNFITSFVVTMAFLSICGCTKVEDISIDKISKMNRSQLNDLLVKVTKEELSLEGIGENSRRSLEKALPLRHSPYFTDDMVVEMIQGIQQVIKAHKEFYKDPKPIKTTETFETIKSNNNNLPKDHLGIYLMEKTKSGGDFKTAVNSAFDFAEFDRMYNTHFAVKTPYESDDEYRARQLNSVYLYNNFVTSYWEKNQKTKYITLMLKGITDYMSKYDPNRQAITVLGGNTTGIYGFPERVELYGDPFIKGENGLVTFDTYFQQGIPIDKDVAVANDVAHNSGDLLLTFKLHVRKWRNGNPDLSDVSSYIVKPSMQIIKCEWIVNNKKLWVWEDSVPK